jgi:siroheme synthase
MVPETPVRFVQSATLTEQRVIQTTLGEAAATVARENLQSPCTVIVGG